jgi:excisionase family DNA binding protein
MLGFDSLWQILVDLFGLAQFGQYSRTGRMKEKESSTPKPFLGVSKASELLGISETTLRRWTDEGRIRVFVTPGGHRRYSANELRQFMQARRAVQGMSSIASHLEDTAPIHRSTAQIDICAALPNAHLPKESQERLARCGRQLLNLVIQYMIHPTKREEAMHLVRQVGQEHGRTLASMGFPLVDSVEAFTKHRNLLVEAAVKFARKGHVPSERAVSAVPLVTRVLDEALISLVAAHQSYRPATPGRRTSH